MAHGQASGEAKQNVHFDAIGTFVGEDGGYTSVAVAVALLLSLTLTFSLASGTWLQNRAADIQTVADATALAGTNVVGSYYTLATCVDALILTFSLTGVVVLGAGLILSAIPGLSGAGATTLDAGLKILDARQNFATSAAKGLSSLEETLPLLIVARSGAVARANATETASYIGCAIPFPAESKSDFSALDTALDTGEIEDVAEQLQETSDAAKESKEQADEALEAGWLADCGNKPMSMYQRAATLAHLSSVDNPYYASSKDWSFGAALVRARAYYASRLKNETPENSGIEAVTDSEVRKVFFAYALKQVRKGTYKENSDGSVEIDLPELPYNTEQMKATEMYTKKLWPCTIEDGVRTLHSTLSCPGAQGAADGKAALRELESGVAQCSVCHMNAFTMGNVSAASTSIDNGFEHYWRKVVEASQAYEKAQNELVEANKALKKLTEQGASLFKEMLEILSTARPVLCPPGAYGCVAAVWRADNLETPEQLVSSFVQGASVGPGAAISAAVLAPDESSSSRTVLTGFFEQISEELDGQDAGVLGSIGSLWSGILEAYASAYEGISSGVSWALGKIEGIPGASAASWLCSKIEEVIDAAGFKPADLRQRKPVLTYSQNVFDKAGDNTVAEARTFVELLGQCQDEEGFAAALGRQLTDALDGQTFTIAELKIPGTNIAFPITVDIGELAAGVFS